MSYFNPEIYNEGNLKPEHKGEVNCWRSIVDGALQFAEDTLTEIEPKTTKELFEKDAFNEFKEAFLNGFEMGITEFCVSMIDNYEEDAE